jgi:hypothetical protein
MEEQKGAEEKKDEGGRTQKKSGKREELEKRLQKEISPFTLADLPIGYEENELFANTYLQPKVLGAGGYGVVVAAVEKAHLEQCAIKVFAGPQCVDHLERHCRRRNPRKPPRRGRHPLQTRAPQHRPVP